MDYYTNQMQVFFDLVTHETGEFIEHFTRCDDSGLKTILEVWGQDAPKRCTLGHVLLVWTPNFVGTMERDGRWFDFLPRNPTDGEEQGQCVMMEDVESACLRGSDH